MDNGDSNNPETSAEGGKKGSGKKKNQKKKKSSNQRKSNSKKSSSGQDLTTKVYATMEKHKEVFFTIRLHSAQSGASLGPIGKSLFSPNRKKWLTKVFSWEKLSNRNICFEIE